AEKTDRQSDSSGRKRLSDRKESPSAATKTGPPSRYAQTYTNLMDQGSSGLQPAHGRRRTTAHHDPPARRAPPANRPRDRTARTVDHHRRPAHFLGGPPELGHRNTPLLPLQLPEILA